VATQSAPIKVFCSYSHTDEDLRKELDKHIKILERREVIDVWHDRRIEAGEAWQGEIDEHLESADVILLLISADFIASDFCYGREMTRALERHDDGKARVIPVFIRPVNWKEAPFGRLQALPTDARPVTSWPDHDEAFVIVSEGIQRAVETILDNRRANNATPAGTNRRPASTSIPRSPFFGFVRRRDTEGRDIVERLKEELAPGKNKLVTLSGPGGIGKTTLAAEAMRSLEGEFGSRIVWSSAETRTDFTLNTLLDDIATQTGHTELRTLVPEAKEAEVRALVAAPPTIIVLDNCETIALPEQKRIEEWLAPAQCSALFTSRPRIGSTLNICVAAMSPEEAQEFLQKLIAQTQDAQIFSADIRQRIYHTAEANPFVMQWVIAQIDEAQEPRTVLEELARGRGDAAQRVFDRSFNLPRLGDDGRAALLALSLFVPSASRLALAEVAGFDQDEGRVNEAIRNLHALWLIKGIDEHRLFTIEGLTRSLTAARLSADARADEFRRRFVAYFLRHAQAQASPTPEAYAALELEKDNILNAMDVAFNLGDWSSVILLMGALNLDGVNGLLTTHGYWDEAIRRGEQALKAAHNSQDETSHSRFAHNTAIIFQYRGEFEEALRLYNESLEIEKKLGNHSGIAITLHELGRLAQAQGELEEARRLYDESLEISKSLGEQRIIAITLHELGILAQARGELDEARRLYDESLDIEMKRGNQSGIAISLHQLGTLAQARGELAEARRLYAQSLEIAKRLGDQHSIANSLWQSGFLTAQEGDRAAAATLLQEALAIFEKLKSPNATLVQQMLAWVESEPS
jgi:tetratricopeptide (TPR) repeat protein